MNRMTDVTGWGFLLSMMVSTGLFAQVAWDGGTGLTPDANWDTAENWDGDTVPLSGADVELATGSTSGLTIDTNGDREVGTLTLNDAAGNLVIYGAGDTLTITTGVEYNGGNNFPTLGSSAGTANDFTVALGTNDTTWNINSGSLYLEGNLTGSGILTKSGGNLRMGGNNAAYTGDFHIQSGNINISFRAPNNTAANNTFGSGDIVFTGSGNVSLNRSYDPTIANNVVNNAGVGDPTFRYSGGAGSGGVSTYTGDFSTGGSVDPDTRWAMSAKMGFRNLTNDTIAEGRYVFTGDWSGYTPGGNAVIAVGEGTVQLNAQQSVAPSGVAYSFNGTSTDVIDPSENTLVEATITTLTSKLIFGGDVTTVANNLNFANSTAAPGGWEESMQSIGSRKATGTVDITGDLNIGNTNAVSNNLFSQESGSTLRVSGVISNSGSSSNLLEINDRYTYAFGQATDPVTGKQLAWQTPDGTVEFTGNNTYGVNTIVNAGTFLVNNVAGSATGSGDLTIANGATLGGAGTIGDGGSVDVTLNGSISPGNSPGTLNMDLGAGTFDLSGADDLVFELGTSSDQVLLISGTLDLGAGVIGFSDFSFFDSGGFTTGVYTLFANNGSLTGSLDGADLTGQIAGLDSTLSVSGSDVIVTVIPEPSTLIFFLLSGVAGVLMVRRRA